MNSKDQNTQTAPFVEFLAVPEALSKNPLFDIIIEEKITLQNYCTALLNKILELSQSNFPAFINYQSNQVEDAQMWLNKLEKLLANNEKLFVRNHVLCRYNKLFNLIEKKRTDLQSTSVKESIIKTLKKFINAESEERHFSFYEIKKQLDKINDDNQKILLLTKEMFEYQQANVEFINQKIPFYDTQCTKEIENIYALQKIQAAIEESQNQKAVCQMPFRKMQINCNLNQFIDIHYQFSRELFVDGKSILDGSVNDLVAIIVNSYVDKDGKNISPETVKTILTPSRTEKRPKPHKRIDIDKML